MRRESLPGRATAAKARLGVKDGMATKTQREASAATVEPTAESVQRELVFDIFRRWGYLQATLDPLGQYLAPEPFPARSGG